MPVKSLSRLLVSVFLSASVTAGPAYAEEKVPTLKDVLGYESGERITVPRDAIAYLKALAGAAPERMRLVEFGTSWEGRPLVYAVIASAETMENLEEIKTDLRKLADARLSKQEASALMDDLPAPVWLSYGVHGNEISSTDASLRVAHTLLSSNNDASIEAILENTIVILDPMQNPDGRNRFVNSFYATVGLEPSGSMIAAERNEPWPNGRTNHYLFDMNRDWFALTQPETRARVRAYLEWMPVIFVDLHEMGSNSTYYFSPEAEPFNPYIQDTQKDGLLAIGKGNAAAFDDAGLEYYTREVFDAHYPGYGAGWPLFHGAVGTTYEQASARGLKVNRNDGTTMTYADTVNGHYTTSMATLKTAADKRRMFLKSQYDNRKSAIALGKTDPIKAYAIPVQSDKAGAEKLAGTLAYQGIEVQLVEKTMTACGRALKPGSFVVPLDQPAGRLARVLLDTQVDVDPDFMTVQEERRAKGFDVQFYDVTAWSLPLMYNVDVLACEKTLSAGRAILPGDDWKPRPGSVEAPDAPFGFVVPWGQASSVRMLSKALRTGVDVRSSDLAFSIGKQDFPAGSLVFQRARYDGDLTDWMVSATDETGATAFGIDESWVDSGPNFGSENSVRHKAPQVAIAWDRPTSPYSAGNARFVVERQLGYPAVPVRTRDLTSDYLAQFDVLIIPEGRRYDEALGEHGLSHLGQWVDQGGVLITLGSGSNLLTNPDGSLSSVRLEDRPTPDVQDGPAILKSQAEADEHSHQSGAPDPVLGSILRASVEPDHWLSAGVKPTLHILTEGSTIFAPLAKDEGVTIARYKGPQDILASGYLWEEAQAQLAYKPAITLEEKGRGYIIAFAQDPTTRAYLDGLNVILANAIFRAAAHAGNVR